jgi:hypothetical protein
VTFLGTTLMWLPEGEGEAHLSRAVVEGAFVSRGTVVGAPLLLVPAFYAGDPVGSRIRCSA